MNRFCTILFLLTSLILTGAAAATSSAVDAVMRISDGQSIDLRRMLAESSAARYFFLAENHDDSGHHAAQLAIIKELQQSGRTLAIGLEMFATTSQNQLDQWVAGKLSLRDFREVYSRNWTLPWSLYEEILLYARHKRIPLIGLNLPPGISRKVARQGFSALTPAERRQLPAGVTCNVGPAYMAFIRQAYANHAMQDKAFTHFCEAQMLWNRNMGRTLETVMAKNPGYTLVALVGIGHALKRAVPDEVTRDADSYRVILPEFAGLNRNNLTVQDADYLLLGGGYGNE
jgi:uncharacterized iron-regulated protein